MSPRRGGESDKVGNRYESAWAITKLLDVLAGRADWIKLEEVGELGKGIEFVLKRPSGEIESHQVKRQRGVANNWSLRGLRSEGVLATAEKQVMAGREFSFVSLIPATEVRELGDQARGSDNLKEFLAGLSQKLQRDFNFLTSAWASPDAAWQTLRGVYAVWPDERELESQNAAIAGLLIAGADGASAAAALRGVAENNLGVTLDADAIWEQLSRYGLRRAELLGALSVQETIAKAADRWRRTVERELLRPPIPRRETQGLLAALHEGDDRVLLAAGAAGAGKSAVLNQVVADIEQEGWPVLALRLDRLEPFATTRQLGEQMDLAVSPSTALAAVAGDRPALLVVDQLDAVSFASGRMPGSFDAVDELIRESTAFPGMRVLLACRQFDIDNDDRLRALISDQGPARAVTIDQLDDAVVQQVLCEMGLDAQAISVEQRTLLRSPLNLVLLKAVADEPAPLDFATTKDLFDRFWERKRREAAARREPQPRFSQVIQTAVDEMSRRQRLTIPVATLDAQDLLHDADVLISEHVLVRDGPRIAFFHEAFFDYAFARLWMARGQSVIEFLIQGEQELFRRAQVRQVLVHLRDEEPDRFIEETREILRHADIRFHIKDVVLALLRALPDPSREEWDLVDALLSAKVPFGERLWSLLRTPAWFMRLDTEGVIEAWLAEEDERRGRALDIMRAAVREHPSRIAQLLTPYAGEHPDFARWLQHLAFFAPLHQDTSFFVLVRDAVARGDFDGAEHDLWMIAHELGDQAPQQGCELLYAYFVERPTAFMMQSEARGLDVLHGDDHGQHELISKCAEATPRRFLELLLPYMLKVMQKTERDAGALPIQDVHFTWRFWKGDIHQTDDALLAVAARALRTLGANDPKSLEPFVELLAADSHDGAQWLLYEALKAAWPVAAKRAGTILLEDEHRLECGYSGSPFWTTRELLQAISSGVDKQTFARLEEAALSLAPDGETSAGQGLSSFTLLSALDEVRLSDPGRRRLGELRRRFQQDQPDEPYGIRAGVVASPIPQDAVEKMTNEQWLRAIAKHAQNERPDAADFLRGGADELANVLAEETKKDPDRFTELGLALGGESNPSYFDAILRGLGQATEPVEPERVFTFLRHAARLEIPQLDRWLGWALRRVLDAEIPDDIIEIVLDRALNAQGPERESWLDEAPGVGRYYGGDPFSHGINTARGSSAETLGDLLIRDVDGHRTGLVVPSLPKLAVDPSVAVRTCVAHVIGACLRHARPAANKAFALLVQSDDRLLAAPPVERLIVYIGWDDPSIVTPTIRRMLISQHENVREVGGRLAAFAGLEFGDGTLFEDALGDADEFVRKGVATICAHRLPHAGDAERAELGVRTLLADDDEEVRKEAAAVAGALRGSELRLHTRVLTALITSPAFDAGLSQLLITLDRAPDRIDDLTFACAERFVDEYRDEAHSIASGAAADAKDIGELLLRTYATTDAVAVRSRALDLLDELLMIGAYGIADLVGAAER